MRTHINVPVRAHIHLHDRAMNEDAIELFVAALEFGLVKVMIEGEHLEHHLASYDGWISLQEGMDGWVEALIWRDPH